MQSKCSRSHLSHASSTRAWSGWQPQRQSSPIWNKWPKLHWQSIKVPEASLEVLLRGHGVQASAVDGTASSRNVSFGHFWHAAPVPIQPTRHWHSWFGKKRWGVTRNDDPSRSLHWKPLALSIMVNCDVPRNSSCCNMSAASLLFINRTPDKSRRIFLEDASRRTPFWRWTPVFIFANDKDWIFTGRPDTSEMSLAPRSKICNDAYNEETQAARTIPLPFTGSLPKFGTVPLRLQLDALIVLKLGHSPNIVKKRSARPFIGILFTCAIQLRQVRTCNEKGIETNS